MVALPTPRHILGKTEMKEFVGGAAPSSTISDPLADITNASGLGFTNRRGKGRAKSFCVVRRNDEDQPFADDRDVSFSTPSSLPMCTGSHGDVTNLTHAEVARKHARNWYASLTQEKKDERNKKDHERRKRKEESQVLNKSATNSCVGKYPKGSNILFLASVDAKTRGLEDLLNFSAGPKNLAFRFVSVPIDLILQSTRNKDRKIAVKSINDSRSASRQ
uniref:Uncharacterized protein n=1 Tax=Oryza glumipatula TaxID=40148 RepID=A0A0E0BU09_9ORYZ